MGHMAVTRQAIKTLREQVSEAALNLLRNLIFICVFLERAARQDFAASIVVNRTHAIGLCLSKATLLTVPN